MCLCVKNCYFQISPNTFPSLPWKLSCMSATVCSHTATIPSASSVSPDVHGLRICPLLSRGCIQGAKISTVAVHTPSRPSFPGTTPSFTLARVAYATWYRLFSTNIRSPRKQSVLNPFCSICQLPI